MQYRTLGRTNIKVSLISLGSGGHSRIGQSTGQSDERSMEVVKTAINLDMNLIDSSEMYGTESLVGQAVKASGKPRSQLIFSSKAGLYKDDRLKTAAELEKSLDGSLKRLQTDFMDIYHLHAVRPNDYAYAVSELIPAMQRFKQSGKIRYIGITEGFSSDPSHLMLQKAVQDDYWDVMMVGFNLLNQSARKHVLAKTQEKNIGVLDMFAVRKALISSENLHSRLQQLSEQGQLDISQFDLNNPLADILQASGCDSLTELAYRFCASEPGIHSILSGTGNPQHLIANSQAILKGTLPESIRQKLISLFQSVDSISGD